MSMETLEFIIHPDGRVQETVTGIVGRSCAEVTAAIESQLGRVVSTEKTAEYYAQNHQTLTGQQAFQATWSSETSSGVF
ncbi:MAG: DUF2997 domain-containing protein [Cyanobacteria bacterium P01_G01_bin.54]